MKPDDKAMLWVVCLFFTALFVGIPLWIYLSNSKMKQTVVEFKSSFWGYDVSMLLFSLMMELTCLFLAVPFVLELSMTLKQAAIIGGIGLAMLALIGLLFTYFRLYWSYWQHDRDKSISFYKGEDLLRYWSDYDYTDYAISDVAKRTVHSSKAGKLTFDYTVLTFKDGSELLITYLLCKSHQLGELLPNSESALTRTWFPWLPKAELA